MNVKLVASTPNIEETIVYIARVSSSRKDKKENPEKLINYLIKNSHWSPFEHGYVTMEIETSKAIGIQLLRHRSFTFQEFSQRYQDVSLMEEMFQDIELRKQATNNRQSSEEIFDPELCTIFTADSDNYFSFEDKASDEVSRFLANSEGIYNALLNAGVARETARMILPMATTTKIYMTGSVRSWLHFLKIRDHSHAQKEIQIIAQDIKSQLSEILPHTFNAIEEDNK